MSCKERQVTSNLKEARWEGVPEAAEPGALEPRLQMGGAVARKAGRVEIPGLDAAHQFTDFSLAGNTTAITRFCTGNSLVL